MRFNYLKEEYRLTQDPNGNVYIKIVGPDATELYPLIESDLEQCTLVTPDEFVDFIDGPTDPLTEPYGHQAALISKWLSEPNRLKQK